MIQMVVVIALVACTTLAHAGSKAAKLKGALLEAHAECVSPNTTVSDAFPITPAPACAPAARSDPACGFGPDGAGTFAFVVGKRGLSVSAKLTGLDAGCEGAQLSLVVRARARTEACAAGGSCIVVDGESGGLFPARPCTVSAGRCQLAGSMPATDLPTSVVDVTLSAIEVRRAGLATFAAGLRLPAGTR